VPPVDCQLERLGLSCTRHRRRRRGLLVGDFTVAVGVDRESLLERRDLGHVDDDVESDLVAGNGNPGVMIDGEVPERVGHDGRWHRRSDHAEQEPEQDATSHHAEGTRPSPGWMIGPGAGTGAATLGPVTQPTSPARGWFITIEGPEGAGKTTQATRLEAWLRRTGAPVVRTREPGGTRLGEQIRDLLLGGAAASTAIEPLADALLFNAARRQLVAEVIRPALDTGKTVVCARFADSTLAYQGYGSGLDVGTLRSLETVATDGLRPDLTILLDLPVEVGLSRKTETIDQTRFETDFDVDFHRRVRDGFLALAAAEPGRFAVVDAAGPEEEVWSAIEAAVGRLVGPPDAPSEPDRPVVRIQG
jgi:dTMP kinase